MAGFSYTRTTLALAKRGTLKMWDPADTDNHTQGTAVDFGRTADLTVEEKITYDKPDPDGHKAAIQGDYTIKAKIQHIDADVEKAIRKFVGRKGLGAIINYDEINKTSGALVPMEFVPPVVGFSLGNNKDPFDGLQGQEIEVELTFRCHPTLYAGYKNAVEP